MARGIADIFEIVVLAAGAHAFLRGGGAQVTPLLCTGKDVLELHHAGIGEEQRRIVARDERAGGNDFVAVTREIIQKCGSNVVGALHDGNVGPLRCRAKPRHSDGAAPI